MTNVRKIFEAAKKFESYAQSNTYDFNLRNLLINTRPDNKNFSFREVADVVLKDLTDLDRAESDAGVTQANHTLLDILNTLTVPDASTLLNAAKQSAAIIHEKLPNDYEKIKIVDYFVNLTQYLINKHLTKNDVSVQEQVADQPTQPNIDTPKENTVAFLQRIFKILKNNQPLSDSDIEKWKNSRNIYSRRLNALTVMKQRSPNQEQEHTVLRFVFNKLNQI